MFKFLRKRSESEATAPDVPTIQRWTATLPPRLRAKLERLHPAEQADRRQLAQKWPEREYVDYLWATFDFLAGTATWRDVQEYTVRISAYPRDHQPLYDEMPELQRDAEEHLAEQNAMIAAFRQTTTQFATDHPEVLQRLVSVVYHVGQGRLRTTTRTTRRSAEPSLSWQGSLIRSVPMTRRHTRGSTSRAPRASNRRETGRRGRITKQRGTGGNLSFDRFLLYIILQAKQERKVK